MRLTFATHTFLSSVLETENDNGLKRTKVVLNWIERYFPDQDIETITAKTVKSAVTRMRADGYSDATMMLMLSFLRKIFRVNEIECKVREWPRLKSTFKGMPMAKDDRDKIFAKDFELKPMVLFAMYTGLRRTNIVNLEWSEVDFKNRQIVISAEKMKSGRDHVMAMIDPVYFILKGLKKTGRFVFGSDSPKTLECVSMQWLRAQKSLSLSKSYRFHDLRHTCATVLIDNDMPINLVADYLNHADIQTTRRYIKMSVKKQKSQLETVVF